MTGSLAGRGAPGKAVMCQQRPALLPPPLLSVAPGPTHPHQRPLPLVGTAQLSQSQESEWTQQCPDTEMGCLFQGLLFRRQEPFRNPLADFPVGLVGQNWVTCPLLNQSLGEGMP